MAKRSDEFQLGQKVVVPQKELDSFVVAFRKKIENRVGVVTKVFPAESPCRKTYCSLVNKLDVEWQKRNGRGKVFREIMSPRDIEPATDEQIKNWLNGGKNDPV